MLVLGLLALYFEALAHNVSEGDKGYIQESSGVPFFPFVYLGANPQQALPPFSWIGGQGTSPYEQ
jgi:hypothetical protein